MIKILFVCLGNYCRSPAAEAIMNKLLDENKLNQQIYCHSAGLTATFLDQNPHPQMINAAAERDYQLQNKAKLITTADFNDSDFIFGMSDMICEELKLMTSSELDTAKIHNLCEFCKYYPDAEVPDPYGDENIAFEFVLDLLEDACQGLLVMLKKQIN